MNKLRLPIVLQQGVISCLVTKLTQANQRLERDYPQPAINYRLRGTRAGTAWLKIWEIRLNPILLLENGESFIQTVVPHELAHLLVYRHFGRVAPHGSEWRWMMEKILDTPAQRTHRFTLTTLQSNLFSYRCACQTYKLTVRRHNKIVRGQSAYHCRQCGEQLLPYDLIHSD